MKEKYTHTKRKRREKYLNTYRNKKQKRNINKQIEKEREIQTGK